MTLYNAIFYLLFCIIGGLLYSTGQYVGFRQGRKSIGLKDEKIVTFDPDENPSDFVDPYYNALHGIETKPGEDTKERYPTI